MILISNQIEEGLNLNSIIKAFESPIEIEVTKTRWEEIKKLQINSSTIQGLRQNANINLCL